jgi:hypothetical protein
MSARDGVCYLLLAAAIPAATAQAATTAVATTSAATATAASQAPQQKQPSISLPKHLGEVMHHFTHLDANADGMLSREEISLAIATSHPDNNPPLPEFSVVELEVLRELARMRTENAALVQQLSTCRVCSSGSHSHGHSAAK